MVLHRWIATSGASLTIACALLEGATLASARELTFDDRVAAQKAIEQVYWNHRIWPKENPGTKPPLATVMPDHLIRAKVEDYLRKSNALEKWWQRPVTAGQLQSELDRMAAHTNDGEMLRELYHALGDDPMVIAETLARQTLVDRLMRAWYAGDTRFHADTKPRAEARTFDAWWSAERDAIGTKIDLPAASYSLPQAPSTTCTPDSWKPTGFTVPDARYSHTAVWTGTEMIVWGGTNAVGTNTGGRYTPATDSWVPTSMGVDVPTPRQESSAVWTGTEMIVWGGFANSGGLTNSGGRYNPTTDSWTLTGASGAPASRFRHTAVWTGTEMIIWGGRTLTSTYFNTGARYRPSTNSWLPTSVGTDVPAARNYHSAVWTGSEMIVWGGSSSTYFNTGGRYDPSTDSWTATSTDPGVPFGRERHTAVWTGTEMIVWGGSPGSIGNTGGRYDPASDTWVATSTGANVPVARDWFTAVWTGSEMIVWGGFDTGATRLNSGGRYNPSTDSWAPTSTGTNAPSPRGSQSAIWTGSEMIIWGGIDNAALYTGGRYKPSTDSWTPTATQSVAPTQRTLHSGVWTGTEMIVWGGEQSSSSYLATGGRYFPATDSWVPTYTGSNAPSARSQHTAIWTGTEMVVWGGYDGISFFNDGGRYDPAADAWTATSTAPGVPDGRLGHTAVWTGTEMIVWGGFANDVYVNTGGRYRPSTDSWTPTSTAPGAPSGRADHSAVWAGTEMIVWGGADWLSYFNTGGRYDPTSETWTATSTGPFVPTARQNHTAVWTGAEMIVWGGSDDYFNTGLNDGARYYPAGDSWKVTSTAANVPAIRLSHTALWTGNDMIVWGGENANDLYLNSGGRYDPGTDAWTPTSTGANVPTGRRDHVAVFTGTQMIVWGGTPWTSTGGSYCICPSGRIVYRDFDGDGYGNAAISIGSCDGSIPAGYSADATDCNDAAASAHPGAVETCNGIDDDCNGLVDDSASGEDTDGDGIHDACDDCPFFADAAQSDFDHDGQGDACDLNDGLIWQWHADKTSVSWQAEQGPTSWNVYIGDLDVLRATGVYTQLPGSNPLADRRCGQTSTVVSDPGTPAPGKVAFSLITGVTAGVEGSLGSSTSGPRVNAHPCP